MMKGLLKTLLGPVYKNYKDLVFRVGVLETVVDSLLMKPEYVSSEETGFNGQKCRKQIFYELKELFHFDLIIETGTWVGDTTGFMRETTQLPVFTCEMNPHFHSLAKVRLKKFDGITFKQGDSRICLNSILSEVRDFERVFIYLDAHWHDDLPLQEEIQIIVQISSGRYVIMVDDFKVPGDDGYGYDDYGKMKTLSLESFGTTFDTLRLVPFFPSAPSNEETGARRGCAVLIDQSQVDHLQKARHLRRL